jgi:hypothetical protein
LVPGEAAITVMCFDIDTVCDLRGVDVRPNFSEAKKPVGY